MLHDYQIGTLKKWRRSRLFINLLPKMFFDMTRRLTALQRNYKSLLKNTTFLVVKISHLTFSLAALGMFQLIYPHSPLKPSSKLCSVQRSINENFLGISVIQAENCIQEFHWEICKVSLFQCYLHSSNSMTQLSKAIILAWYDHSFFVIFCQQK